MLTEVAGLDQEISDTPNSAEIVLHLLTNQLEHVQKLIANATHEQKKYLLDITNSILYNI